MLELKNISKSFGDARVLDDISLTLDDGQIMSILGPSGGGKTTLLNIVLGITDATSGRLLLDGEDLTDVPMEKRGFNIVFQDYALFPNLNAYENITYGLRNHPGVSTADEIRELIGLLGLEEHLDKRIDELSGGQKQRVALARTLVMKPRLLLLDEPLAALDGVIKESIKAKIAQIVEQYRLTTIMVTHDPEEACTMSDRVLILNGGHIAQYDTPENILEHPASDFVRSFILRQLEVKRNNIYSLFSDDGARPLDAAAQEA
ncbi:ABC transporter ATP-binding protein [Bifidobacterium eulemuris]|uniref:ABC-type quaternary amine transporter n=1 Tax=Bifidobacterium eulemuris TaxID=1765219 RepID=A0A261G9R9_9BIFI|nr:ABC transporter ATP-binding protein [Bifidobacterium eulemuris]OZG68154.1 ABC transporter [Bifidobacterium eulemuris]QOL31784.1 ABC transporter ATP-binding protein [Bifidobacterium eulemuris]